MLTAEQLVKHYALSLTTAQPGAILAQVEQFIIDLAKQVGPILANAILAFISSRLGINLPPLTVPVVSASTAQALGGVVPAGGVLNEVLAFIAALEAFLSLLKAQGHA